MGLKASVRTFSRLKLSRVGFLFPESIRSFPCLQDVGVSGL